MFRPVHQCVEKCRGLLLFEIFFFFCFNLSSLFYCLSSSRLQCGPALKSHEHSSHLLYLCMCVLSCVCLKCWTASVSCRLCVEFTDIKVRIWPGSECLSATVCLHVCAYSRVDVCVSHREKCLHEGGESNDSDQTERQFKLLGGRRDSGHLWTSATVLQEATPKSTLVSFPMYMHAHKHTYPNSTNQK